MFFGVTNSLCSMPGLAAVTGGVGGLVFWIPRGLLAISPVLAEGLPTIAGFLGRELSGFSSGRTGWPQDSVLFAEDPCKVVSFDFPAVLTMAAVLPIPVEFAVVPLPPFTDAARWRLSATILRAPA